MYVTVLCVFTVGNINYSFIIKWRMNEENGNAFNLQLQSVQSQNIYITEGKLYHKYQTG